MGCGMPYIKALERAGVFRDGRAAVLDIGPANLHGASEEDVCYLFEKYGKQPLDARLRARAADLAYRSYRRPDTVLTYLAEVLDETTITYESFDIFHGPKTRIFDLNRDSLPEELAGRYDAVFNFGTTEHVFNQYNAFKVIHEALKPGGYVFHQLPMTGFFNHGYFCYHPRMFAEMAAANQYRVVNITFSEPQGSWRLEEHCTPPDNLADATEFRATLRQLGAEVPVMPNGLVNVFLQKRCDRPFRLPLEGSAPWAISITPSPGVTASCRRS